MAALLVPFHHGKKNCHRFNCWSNVPLYSHLNTNCRFRKLTFCSKFWYQTCLPSWIFYAYKILWNSLSLANRKRRSHAGAEPFFSIFHRKNRNVKVFAICFIICTTHGKYVYYVDPVRQMDYKALEHGK